jgi:5-methyltetrahydropteroyltriglutamate--homocysteine methyltransferase
MVLTTVVGSYPRIGDASEEQALRRSIARLDRGEITEEELGAVERDTVKAILREQNDSGIDLVTDGQISWYDSQSHIAGKLSSIEIDGLVRYFDTNTYYRQPVVRGPVARKAPLIVDEWKFAEANSEAPVKAVLTGPVTLASLALDKHYRTTKALAIDLATALAQEVEALVAAGASHVQIDEPILTRHPEHLSLVSETLERIRSHKGSSSLALFTYFGDVAKIYRDLADGPADVLGLDLVQGSATWPSLVRQGSEKPIVLGLIDARNTKEEDPAAIAKKVSELGSAVNLKASYLAPSNGLEFLPRDRARKKLRILRAAADAVGVAG